ncbi:hypothetical protein [Saccharopolyspora hirsuta]|nr:hypothetical protein [Saccharopolyspora hirsuta]
MDGDPARRDVEVEVLVDCTPAEVEPARAFVRDVLGAGGLLVER